MISAFFFQYNKIEFHGEEKTEIKKLTKRVEQTSERKYLLGFSGFFFP